MPRKIPRKIRAFAFGLIMGIGGEDPYPYKEIASIIEERFGIEVAASTLRGWKHNKEKEWEKHGINREYIKEVMAIAMAGGMPGRTESENKKGQKTDAERTQNGDEDVAERRRTSQIPELSFKSLAEAVSFMEQQGFMVATSPKDMRDILQRNGLTVIQDGQLQIGYDAILAWEPLDIGFEALGKKIGGNVVILWYYGLYRKLSAMAHKEAAELDKFVTGCVVDAMNARGWTMAAVRGRTESREPAEPRGGGRGAEEVVERGVEAEADEG